MEKPTLHDFLSQALMRHNTIFDDASLGERGWKYPHASIAICLLLAALGTGQPAHGDHKDGNHVVSQIFVVTLTGETVTIDALDSDSVLQFKRRIQARTWIPAFLQRLSAQGKQLEPQRWAHRTSLHCPLWWRWQRHAQGTATWEEPRTPRAARPPGRGPRQRPGLRDPSFSTRTRYHRQLERQRVSPIARSVRRGAAQVVVIPPTRAAWATVRKRPPCIDLVFSGCRHRRARQWGWQDRVLH